MKFTLRVPIYCPTCHRLLVSDSESVYCFNRGCKMFNIRYELPSVELNVLQVR